MQQSLQNQEYKKLIFHKQSPYKKIVKTLQLQLKKDDAIKNP